MSRTHVVLLAGGKGRRFWPMSRESRPKAFLPLSEGETLLGASIARLDRWIPEDRRWIVVPEQLNSAACDFAARVIVEPEARDTGAAIIYASLKIELEDPGATQIFLPADHFIADADRFRGCLEDVVSGIEEDPGRIVTLGVTAEQPSPMLGHLEVSRDTENNSDPWFDAERFIEKPTFEESARLLEGGRVFLNSGIFAWKGESLRDCIRSNVPQLSRQVDVLEKAIAGDRDDLCTAYQGIPATSIDYLLMEQVPDLRVRKLDVPWLDLGSWSSLHGHLKKDGSGNVVVAGDGHLVDSKNCIVRSTDGRPVFLFGCQQLAVIDEGDVLLVMPLDRAAEVPDLMDKIKKEGLEELL